MAGQEGPRSFAELFQPDYAFPYFTRGHDWPTAAAAPPAIWSVERAVVLAQLSLLVYLPESAQVRDRLGDLGLAGSRFFNRGGTQAWIFETPDDLIIVFRGTEPGVAEDVLTDLNLLPTSIEGEVSAHRGFVQALESVDSAMNDALAAASQKQLWLAGHSLGGALAQLYGWQHRDRVAAVYTFGAPRTFATGSASKVDAAVRIFRVENGNDVVPHLPTPPLFAHAGETWFIDHERKLLREPALHHELQTVWRGHLNFIESWVEQWRDSRRIRLVSGPALADHAPVAYAEALISNLP